MTAFITGSHAYGTPKPTSDVDLVVKLSQEELDLLRRVCHESAGRGSGEAREGGPTEVDEAITACGFRFGKLNLLVVTRPEQVEAWACGTRRLKDLAPVTRERACDEFAHARKERGLDRLGEPITGDQP